MSWWDHAGLRLDRLETLPYSEPTLLLPLLFFRLPRMLFWFRLPLNLDPWVVPKLLDGRPTEWLSLEFCFLKPFLGINSSISTCIVNYKALLNHTGTWIYRLVVHCFAAFFILEKHGWQNSFWSSKTAYTFIFLLICSTLKNLLFLWALLFWKIAFWRNRLTTNIVNFDSCLNASLKVFNTYYRHSNAFFDVTMCITF